MSYTKRDYYSETIAEALCQMGQGDILTAAEIDEISEAVEISHENESIAFYSPPASDSYARIDREWQGKYEALKADFDHYRNNSETAMKRALRLGSNANISIGEHGGVTLFNGRSERVL